MVDNERPRIPFNGLSLAMAIVATVGFLDATYLTAKHYLNFVVPCSAIANCEYVLTSPYATVIGIPVALFGAVFYLATLILALVYRETRNTKILRALSLFTLVGFLASLYLVSLQLFVLSAICLYCMVSAGTSTTLFALGVIALKKI